MIKDKINTQWRDAQGKVWGEDGELPLPLYVHHSAPLHMLTNQEVPSPLGLYVGFTV